MLLWCYELTRHRFNFGLVAENLVQRMSTLTRRGGTPDGSHGSLRRTSTQSSIAVHPASPLSQMSRTSPNSSPIRYVDSSPSVHRRTVSASAFDGEKAASRKLPNAVTKHAKSPLRLVTDSLNSSRVSFHNPLYSPAPIRPKFDDMNASMSKENSENGSKRQREHEETLSAYVQQLTKDLEQERLLVKQLLTNEREYAKEKECYRQELEKERLHSKQLAERLFGARRDADMKERCLQRALADMRAWRRLGEESLAKQRDLEFQLDDQTKPISGVWMRLANRLLLREASSRRLNLFEKMKQDIARLQQENNQLGQAMLDRRREDQFEKANEELLFASTSFLNNSFVGRNGDENISGLNNQNRESWKKQLESSLLRSFDERHT